MAQRRSALLMVVAAFAFAGGCAQVIGADFDRPLGSDGSGGAGATGSTSRTGTTSSRSSSTGAGGAGEGGSSSSAGGGVHHECEVAGDCTQMAPACQTNACTANKCTFADLPEMTSCSDSGGRLCKSGACVACIADADCGTLADDCQKFTCQPDNTCLQGDKPDMTACGVGGAFQCMGGKCHGCVADGDCGVDTPCTHYTCTSSDCSTTNEPDGTATSDQAAGNCVKNACERGVETPTADASDVPPDDGNECTDETCQGTMPMHPNSTNGTPCSTGVCNAGACVACNVDADCTGGTECAPQACTNHVCGTGTPALKDTPCNTTQFCDGAGSCVACNTTAQCGNAPVCKVYTCSASHTCTQANATNGTACSPPSSGVCMAGLCGPNHCGNGTKDVDETGMDCGGSTCAPCMNGTGCMKGSDCLSGFCPTTTNVCATWATAITAGMGHACALLASGTVKCWGLNNQAQLGDSTSTDRSIPVTVQGLSGVTAVSAGEVHSCAVASGIKCWGDNSCGELGNATTGIQVNPPVSAGLSGTDVIAGHYATCAIGTSGRGYCWGCNGDGNVGDGSTTTPKSPAAVTGLSANVTSMATSYNLSCGVVSGAAKCWGLNLDGALGDGSFMHATCPDGDCALTAVQVSGLGSGVSKVSSRYDGQNASLACALVGGNIKCWGSNNHGQLGDGVANHGNGSNCQTDCSPTPVMVSNIGNAATTVSASNTFACAIVNSAVKCWGWNDRGQLGNGTTTDSSTPVQVTGLTSGYSSVVTGGAFACALDATYGAVKCWGFNPEGRLGNGTTVNSTVPVPVTEN